MICPLRSRRLFVAALVLASALAPAASRAQGPSRGGRFELSGDFLVEVAGKPSPKATLYQSPTLRSYLVIAPELTSPVLISAASGQIERLDLMKVARQEGFVDLLPEATLAVEGPWKMEGENLVFQVGGKSVRLTPRAWLLGLHTGADLLEHDPGYGRKAALFTPISDVVARVRSTKADVRVLAFFGSWCPHCKDQLPALLKVEQALKGSTLRFDYYGVPSPFNKEPEATKWEVKGVPTAIVIIGGKEAGRIVGTQWGSPETAIYDLLKKANAL